MEKIAVVTGGSRGIGAATFGVHAIAVRANVSEESEVERLFESVDKQLGPITAQVNECFSLQQTGY